MRPAPALLLALFAAPPAGAQESERPEAPADAVTVEELRALHELDLDHEVVLRGRHAVRAGGPLASSGEAVALVARALASVGREDAAAALLEDAEPDGASRPWIALESARLALERDRLELALERLGTVADGAFELRHPDRPESWLLAARVFSRAGDERRAERFAERFVELAPLHPEAPVAWHLLELAAAGRGDVELALERRAEKDRLRTWHDVVKARRLQIRRDPEAPEPRFGLALAWMTVERFDRAEEVLADLAGRAPGWCRLWFHLGESRRRLGRDAEALEAFDRGVACDPDDLGSRFQRAEMRWRAGERDAAVRDFRSLLATEAARDPDFAALHLRLAEAAEAAGDETAARAHRSSFEELQLQRRKALDQQ